MSEQALRAELERLKLENQRLIQASQPKAKVLKVSEKGALSIYGMGRFPITHYPDQFLEILEMGEQIKAFINDHKQEFADRAVANAEAQAEKIRKAVGR